MHHQSHASTNPYLAELDAYMADVLHQDIRYYKRYIDDILVIAPQEKKAVEYSADVHAKPHSKSWAAQLTSEDAERAEGKAQKRKEKKAG